MLWFGPRIEPHIGISAVLRLSCEANYALRPNQLETYRALDTVISSKMLGRSNVYFLSQNEVYRFDFSKDFMNCKDIFWADGSHFSEAGEKYFGSRFNVLDYRFR